MMSVSPNEVERFRALIAARLGLAFDDSRLPVLADVLAQRTALHDSTNPANYLERYVEGRVQQELGALAEQLTVCETYFFRNLDHFRALTETVVPTRLNVRGGERTLRVLSAGCASGEEAYSVAIALRENVPELAGWSVSIIGADINPAALEKAARGRYSSWSLREAPSEIREHYFVREGGDFFRIDGAVRRMVSFEQRNLADPESSFWPPGYFDVVFCRNILMYLAPSAACTVVERVTRALAPEGYLFLGHAETLRGLSQAFHLRHTHGTFYYQLRGSGELGDEQPAPHTKASPSPPPYVPSPSDSWMATIQQAAQRIEELSQSRHSAAMPVGATTLMPARSSADLARALELVEQERFDEALALLAALPAEPAAGLEALLLRAVLLTNHGKPYEAEAVCRQLLQADELNAGAHYLMALCREHAGDRVAAADHDQYALYLDPGFAMPRLHLGLIARRAGDLDAARRELGQALVLLVREDASRLLLLGGGFSREGLIALCRAELRACGGEG